MASARLAPPRTDSSSSTPPILRGRRDVGPASTPSIALSHRPVSASFDAGEGQLDVAELWRRTAGHDGSQGGGEGEGTAEARRRVGRSRRASSITSAALNPSSAASRRLRRSTSTSEGPSMLILGLLLLLASFLLSTLGLYTVLFSSSFPPTTGVRWVDWVGNDQYWKYLVPLQVTVVTGWVIVNWGSLKILRHAQHTGGEGAPGSTAKAVPYDSPTRARP